MLHVGIIIPVYSAWLFPVVLALKKDEKAVFCLVPLSHLGHRGGSMAALENWRDFSRSSVE